MDRETSPSEEAPARRAETKQKPWEEPRLTRHGDLEKVTGQGLLANTSHLPSDPGEDF